MKHITCIDHLISALWYINGVFVNSNVKDKELRRFGVYLLHDMTGELLQRGQLIAPQRRKPEANMRNERANGADTLYALRILSTHRTTQGHDLHNNYEKTIHNSQSRSSRYLK